jgi:hypothetical protein
VFHDGPPNQDLGLRVDFGKHPTPVQAVKRAGAQVPCFSTGHSRVDGLQAQAHR